MVPARIRVAITLGCCLLATCNAFGGEAVGQTVAEGPAPTEQASSGAGTQLELLLRTQVPTDGGEPRPQLAEVEWDPRRTAMVICDMWNEHWCKGATRRVGEMARNMPAYRGVLVSEDGAAAMISAEVLESSQGGETYNRIRALAEEMAGDLEVQVAGEAAASGYLMAYLNRDSAKLLPLGGVTMALTMLVAFRTVAGVGLPFMVMLATLAGAVGIMSALGVPYYVITNALPAILIGIAVADSVHILSHYYEDRAAEPGASRAEAAARAAREMWRPITLTTLTTIAGFAGIAATSNTPPMMWFGVFAIVGILIAYVFSLFCIPAGLALFGGQQSKAFAGGAAAMARDPAARIVTAMARFAVRRPGLVVAAGAVSAAVGVYGASLIRVDSSVFDQFQADEPLVVADKIINDRFHGTSFLDVVIEAPGIDALTEPDRLAKVEALQAYIETLPHVSSTTSIVDHLKKLNQALNYDDPAAYVLPNNDAAIAQLLFLLTASGDPTEWRDDINADQNSMLVRVVADTGRYRSYRGIVDAAQRYIDREWAGLDMTATLTGAMAVGYHWLQPLLTEHVLSVVVSLALVFVMSAVLFRSLGRGLLTLTPVVNSVLVVYAAMGFFGVNLDAAASMFAAIAVGLGIDFAIHMADRIDHYRAKEGISLDDAIERVGPRAGRALFFNFAAVFFGFSVVGLSELPIMQRFGALVAAAVLASFIASIMLIPALLKLSERYAPLSARIFNRRNDAV